jgi:hypothetical protein
LVERHDILRSVFPDADGKPYQRVLDVPAGYPLLRATRLSEDELARAMTEEAHRGFDLAVEPAFRARLFVVAPDEQVLVLSFHHIVFDGWSIGPLLGDLATAYRQRCAGRAPGWRPLPVQYADYAVWQRDLLGAEGDPDSLLSSQLAYWTEALADLPGELRLPTDFPRPAVPSHAGDEVEFEVGPTLYRELVELARKSGATVFMVFHALVAAWLTKFGAGTDIPLGSPIAGRTDDALNELVGFFVNTVVLRTDTSGDPTFRELVHRVRETDLAAYAHQDIPFEYLVEALNPDRSLAKQPLFQTMLTFHNGQDDSAAMSGLAVRPELVRSLRTKFDLTVQLNEVVTGGVPTGIRGVVEYSTDLFSRSTIERMTDRLLVLLRAVAADADLRLSQVDLLVSEERHRVLIDWNNTASGEPWVSLPELFEAQVERTPAATAIMAGSETLSYRELNARANRLASALIDRGAGPERYVAIALPSSVELVVAVLAVLKSGSGYLPIDPAHPVDRIAFVLADADPVLVLTTAELAGRLPAGDAVRMLMTDPVELSAVNLTERPGQDSPRM